MQWSITLCDWCNANERAALARWQVEAENLQLCDQCAAERMANKQSAVTRLAHTDDQRWKSLEVSCIGAELRGLRDEVTRLRGEVFALKVKHE